MANSGSFTYYPISGVNFGLRADWSASYVYINPARYASVTVNLYLDWEAPIDTPSFFYSLYMTGETASLDNCTGFSSLFDSYRKLKSFTHLYTMTQKSGVDDTYELSPITISAFAGSSSSGTYVYYNGTQYYLTLPDSTIQVDDLYDPGSSIVATISNTTQTSAVLTLTSGTSLQLRNWWYSLDGSQIGVIETGYADSVSMTLTGLTTNTTYSVYGGASDNYGRSPQSNTVSFITSQSAPPTISLTIQNVTGTTFDLSATASESCYNWSYILNGTTYSFSGSPTGTVVSQSVTGLSAGTTYSVQVTATAASTMLTGSSSTASVTTNGKTTNNAVSYSMSLTSTPSFPINVTVADTSNRHDLSLRYTKDGSTKSYLLKSKIALTTGSNTISLASDAVSQITSVMGSSTSYTFDLVLVTYDSSGNWLGFDESSDLLVTIPSDAAPIFTNFTYADISSDATALSGSNQILVAGYSEILINASTAAAQTGTIVSYSASYGSSDLSVRSTSSTFNLAGINISGTNPLTVTVTDSYGRSTSVTKQVTTITYTKITQGALVLSTEVVNDERVVHASVSGSFYNTGNNDLEEFYYQYRRSDETTWSTKVDVTPTVSGGNFSISDYVLPALDPDYSYYIRFVSSDLLTSTFSEAVLSTDVPLMSFRSGMVGVNNKNPNSALDVIGIIEQNGFGVEGFVRTVDSTEDLNEILDTGIYVAQWTTGAMSSNHYPVEATGVLEVLPDTAAVLQRFTIVPADGRIWIRSGDGSSFSSWHQIAGSGSFIQEQADWNTTDSTAASYIRNKPIIPDAVTVDSDISPTSNNPVRNSTIYSAFQNVSYKTIETIAGTQTASTYAFKGVSEDSALYDGKMINYYLPYAGTSTSATLTLTLADGTDTAAIPCYFKGTTRLTTHYAAGSVIFLTYRENVTIGSTTIAKGWWGPANYYTSNSPTAIVSTAAGTAAKTSSGTYYALHEMNYLQCILRYSNSVKGAITLNINSTGAKPIYINGSPSSSTNYTLPAGSYFVYYDGTAYQFRTDGVIPGKIMGAKTADNVEWTGITNRPTLSYASVEAYGDNSILVIEDV